MLVTVSCIHMASMGRGAMPCPQKKGWRWRYRSDGGFRIDKVDWASEERVRWHDTWYVPRSFTSILYDIISRPASWRLRAYLQNQWARIARRAWTRFKGRHRRDHHTLSEATNLNQILYCGMMDGDGAFSLPKRVRRVQSQ